MRLRRALGLALLVLTVQASLAAAQELTGAIFVETALVVGEGETMVLGPGASLSGPGSVEVHGRLVARGTGEAPVQLAVPLRIHPNASADLRHVRLWGVDGAAVTLRGGNLTLVDALLEANGLGIDATDARVTAQNATLRDHATGGARLAGATQAAFANATFAGNGHNVLFEPADGARLDVLDSTMSAPALAVPSLHVRSNLTGDERASVVTRRVAFEGGDVAVRVEGAGVSLSSTDDVFSRVRVALDLDETEASVTRARFDSLERDVDAGPQARLSFTDVRFTPAAVAAPLPAPAAPPALSGWWALLVGIVAAGGTLAWARARLRAAPAPAEPEAPPPDLATPLSPTERRILVDLAAHPESAQAAIAARLGMTRQALHYHVKKLEARRLLRKTAQGRETRCTIAPGVEPILRESVSSSPR